MRRWALAVAVLAVSAAVGPAWANSGVNCRVVQDAAGDAALLRQDTTGSSNAAALDVVSADVATGTRNVTAVVRVAGLGTAADAAPRMDQWSVFFKFRGAGFAATAGRAVDGTEFYLAGDFPERSAAPGLTASVPVSGSFDPAANEVRVSFPRDLIGHTRAGQKITDIVVVTYTGLGTLSTEQTGAYAETQVDDTAQPGPSVVIGANSCVRSS
jgi:hypothetical protein